MAAPRYTTESGHPADPSGRRLPWRSFIELPIVVWWWPSFFQQVLQQTRPGAARPSPQPAWYAQLRSYAAALPPFIMRHAILPDPRLRPTDEAFDLKSANRSPDDIWLSDVRLAVFVSLCSSRAARLSELCSGP
jgi:hypothetical protein